MNQQTIDYRNTYGAIETNGLIDGIAYHAANSANQHPEHPHGVCWSTAGLKVTRFRLLTDIGVPFYDVSYCDGVLDGYHVRVQLPFSQLAKGRQYPSLTAQVIAYARADGIFAKGLGILDCVSILK